ncbi:MAG: sulfite exporter TauE/SafE family protein [Pseudomonadota bacterium]
MTTRRSHLWPFFVWLFAFYAIWLGVVLLGQHGPALVEHWPIALAMMAGSYFAGSTPLGGGTVGFPILVLLMNEPATLGRDFSFAVQSIGMTSATIFIWCRRQSVEWPMLRAALIGATIGTPLGILLVAPLVSGLFIKLLFAVLWGSFGILHFQRLQELIRHEGITPTAPRFDRNAGLAIGFFGGISVASITGVGIDMVIYTLLVLLCHADLRIAIATSVVLMAWTSVVGTVTKLVTGTLQPGVFEHWLAAAPIVAVGAPLGALVVARIGRKVTLVVVSILCVAQFFWTLAHEWQQLDGWTIAAAFLGLGLFVLLFQELHDLGDRLARRAPAPRR